MCGASVRGAARYWLAMRPSRAIRDLVLGWCHDASVGDPTELLSASDSAIFIGTGPGEYWVGGSAVREALRIQGETIGRPNLVPREIVGFEEGDVGWASCQLSIGLEEARLDARFTCVFAREGGEWRMVQAHISHEVGNEAWGMDVDLSMERIAQLISAEKPDLSASTSSTGVLTIMFTDIESSTALNEALGDGAFVELLDRHRSLVDRCAGSHDGSVVKSLGDGFMLAFRSAAHGVGCAIDLQRELRATGVPFRVRIGLHAGSPVARETEFYGRDVAYAARVGAVAAGGEIVVSDPLRALLGRSERVGFGASRYVELKGFDGPQLVHPVDWAVDWAADWPADRT